MLFSLVLAVASKEVELWQTFDDFAPRHLMDEGEEMEAMEDPEMDGDEEEPLEGDEMTGDLAEEEEEGLNPLMIAVPAAAALAVGGYFLMNKGGNDKPEDKPFMDRLTVDGLKNDSEVQAAAGLTAAVTGLGLYALLGGGGQTPVATGFLSSGAGLAATGVLGATGVIVPGYYGGRYMGWWGGKSPMQEYEETLKKLQKTQQTTKKEWEDAEKAGFFKESEKEAHEKQIKDLKEKIKTAGDKAEKADKDELAKLEAKMTEAEHKKKKEAKENADNAVTEHVKTKPEEKKK